MEQQSSATSIAPKPFPVLAVLLSFLVLLLLGSATFLAYQNMQLNKLITDLKKCSSEGGQYIEAIGRTPACRIGPDPIPTPTPIMTFDWKTYTNKQYGVTLKYPIFYNPVEKFTPLKSGEPIFIVTGTFNFNPQNISFCKTYQEVLCLIPGKNWAQAQDVLQTTIFNKKAISFFVSTKNIDSANNVIHVVQTTEKPFIEIALTVDGEGGEATFEQILSTFKLLEQGSTSTQISDSALTEFIRTKFSLSQNATINIGLIDGNYANGSAGEPNGGGWWWGAAKINGNWSYALNGTGLPDCDKISIFPLKILNGYFDRCVNSNGKLFDRPTGKEVV